MKAPTKPTLKAAVLKKCHDCMGAFADGLKDCENTKCSLYPWMIRRGLEPDLEWLQYNPRRQGVVRFDECQTKEMTEEQKQKMARILKDARAKANARANLFSDLDL